MDDVTWWMWYRGLRRNLGKWRKKKWVRGQHIWHMMNPEPLGGHVCHLCLHVILRKDFSLDHLITVDEIFENSLDVELLWHPSNLKAAHISCNSSRGVKPLENWAQYAKV